MRISALCCVFVVAMMLAQSEASAQWSSSRQSNSNTITSNANSGVVKALQRLDINRDGVLSSTEMAGRTKSYVKGLGFDPNRSVRITSIQSKLNQEKLNRDRRAAEVVRKRNERYTSHRKVDDFSFEPKPFVGVPGFDGDFGNLSDEELMRKFGTSSVRSGIRTLKKYDRDKNGVLDATEQKRASWGSPTPQQSDKNKDGKLSKYELILRYNDREQASKRAQKAQLDAQRRAADAKAKAVLRSQASKNAATYTYKQKGYVPPSKRREAFSNNRLTRSNSNPFGNRVVQVSTPTTRKSSNFNSGADRYRRYVEGLMRQYDKNNDKKLSKDEVSKMRRKPTGADTNRDGFITIDEYTQHLANKSSGSSSSTVSSKTLPPKSGAVSSKFNSSKNQSTKRATSSNSRGTGRSSPRTNSSFSSLDKDQDGQIRMSEFATKWDESVVKEFEAKDLNRDGLITAAEWSAPPPKPDYNAMYGKSASNSGNEKPVAGVLGQPPVAAVPLNKSRSRDSRED